MPFRLFTSALAAIADEREGIVTRSGLLAADFTRNDVKTAVERRLLRTVLPGIYLVARDRLSPNALLHAAVAYAEPAMLDGMCAAEHYGWFRRRENTVMVATSRLATGRTVRTLVLMSDGKPGLVTVRPTAVLDARIVDGLPTASVPRTLISIAASHDQSRLERAWKQADFRKDLDLVELGRELDRTRRRGTPKVRALYLEHPGLHAGPAHFNSPFEVEFRQLIEDAGLPAPLVNAPVWANGRLYVVDFLWPELRLVAEVDDPNHDRPLARDRDRAREADLSDVGLVVERFATHDLARDPALEMRRLGAALRRQARLIAS